MHELSVASAIVDTAIRHARGPPRQRRLPARSGRCARSSPSRSASTSTIVTRDTVCERRRLELELGRGADALRLLRAGVGPGAAARPHEGELIVLPQFRCPACSAAGAEVLAGNELLVESIDVRGRFR